MTTLRPLLVAGAALAAAAIAAPAALAAPVTIKTATLNWSQTNHYGATSTTRTFLGHTTNPLVSGSQSNGTVPVADGATLTAPDGSSLTQVGPTSPRGLGETYNFGFPSVSGTYDRAARTGKIQTKGSLTYVQYPWLTPAPPAPIKINGLLIDLKPTGGAVYANVTGPAGAGDYPSTSTPLFNLNVANATTTDLGNGRVVISNLVPTLGRGNVFGTTGQYAPGTSGPDRTPNTWGAFSVTIDTKDPEVKTVTVTKEVTKTVNVNKTSELIEVTLNKAPFPTSKQVINVLAYQPGTKTIDGKGFVFGKRLWLVVPAGTQLKATYTLVRVSGSKKLPKSKKVLLDAANQLRVK